jgi:hypothetical protein
MSDHDFIQIDSAARGCVSGTLVEWPHLRAALDREGRRLPTDTPATELQAVCREIMGMEALR